jgi:hypothetical protein
LPGLSSTLDDANVIVNPIFFGAADEKRSQRLEEMAGLTGGKSYLGPEIADVVNQISSWGAGTYSIAYDPTASNWDSKFHKLKVACSRPGVTLVNRQRYFAWPTTSTMAKWQLNMMYSADHSTWDVRNIGLRATAAVSGSTLKVQLRVDPVDLVMRESDGQWTASITLAYSTPFPRLSDGEMTTPEDMDLRLTVAQHDAALKGGIAISKDVPISASSARKFGKVRLIVLDKSSDSVGSLTIPVGR